MCLPHATCRFSHERRPVPTPTNTAEVGAACTKHTGARVLEMSQRFARHVRVMHITVIVVSAAHTCMLSIAFMHVDA